MILDVVFIRHGLSCANVLSTVPLIPFFLYPDPELTKQGIFMSKSLSARLVKNLYTRWGDEPFSVCSSQMIRAQETAFYMVASTLGLPINVLPFISESGGTPDNYAVSTEKQLTLILKRNPAVADLLLKGKDGREKQTIGEKSNFKRFMQWASENTEYFKKGSDGVLRAVIFSHGHFLKKVFGLDFAVKNNEAIHARIDLEKLEINKRFEYWPNNIDYGLANCPNECSISYCR